MSTRSGVLWALGRAAAVLVGVLGLWPASAQAIPAFGRRYETSCETCHQGHYPRLNALGRQFRDNGYQMPDGAEDWARAQRSVEPGPPAPALAIFKEVPLSVRGQVFGVVPAHPGDAPVYQNSIFSFLMGGGSIGEDVSYFFSWTPFPDPSLHQARIGLHNLFAQRLGEGTVNIRAGSFFLLDFQRPEHRFLSNGASQATQVVVGGNDFTLADSTLGVEIYGRPGWGPLHYELALVQGDAEGGLEQDDWKDVFARMSLTAFQNTDHELTPGLFAYVGRSEFETQLGDLRLAQRDDFWIAGADVELDLGPVNLFAMAFRSRHGDALQSGEPVTYNAVRGEVLWVIRPKLVTSVRFDGVSSADDPALDSAVVAPHLTYVIAPNVLATVVWRHDIHDFGASSALAVLDVAF